MNDNLLNDAQIVESWRKNAAPWIEAIRQQQIESRKLVTDSAIAQAILSRSPSSVLDLGCGEGWLVRYLIQKNIQATGVDAIEGLIANAKQTLPANFQVLSYEEIIQGKLNILVDVVVCNFSLFGREIVAQLLQTIPRLICPHGSLIVQTLHPVIACGQFPYQDGWREGSWSGFDSEFTSPPPWYFRTIASWIQLFKDSGWKLIELSEPIHPTNKKPASIIFVSQLA